MSRRHPKRCADGQHQASLRAIEHVEPRPHGHDGADYTAHECVRCGVTVWRAHAAPRRIKHRRPPSFELRTLSVYGLPETEAFA